MASKITYNSVISSISHHYQPRNKHYYFSPHTLHCNTYLQVPCRLTSQLSATCTYHLTISRTTPPNLLLNFSKSYVASNNIKPVHPWPQRDYQSPSTSCIELKLFCSSSQTLITLIHFNVGHLLPGLYCVFTL